jgi:hypothetical protein
MSDERVVEQESVSAPATETTTTQYNDPASPPSQTVSDRSVVSETVRHTPSGAETARRVIVFLFGVVQVLIAVRIVLLLAYANQANQLVRFIYDASAIFVGPFDGILHTNAVHAGHSVLDIAAVVALVGWTILEALVLALVRIGRREP